MGFESLITLEDNLEIIDNNFLASLNRLITFIGVHLEINNNDTLTSLSRAGKPDLHRGIPWYLRQQFPDQFVLVGEPYLHRGNLNIYENNALVSLSGLENLISIGGNPSYW